MRARELGTKIVTKCQGVYIPNLCNIKLNADELNSLLIFNFCTQCKVCDETCYAMSMHVQQTVLACTSLSLSLWGLLGLRYSDVVHEWASVMTRAMGRECCGLQMQLAAPVAPVS